MKLKYDSVHSLIRYSVLCSVRPAIWESVKYSVLVSVEQFVRYSSTISMIDLFRDSILYDDY